jgi:hypothetical protein
MLIGKVLFICPMFPSVIEFTRKRVVAQPRWALYAQACTEPIEVTANAIGLLPV